MLDHALGYLGLGWSVIPINPKLKRPSIKWKPYQIKLPTPAQVTRWFNQRPDSNVGIITGSKSGICSLDTDSPEADEIIRHKFDLPDTIIQETGRGRQYLFRYPKKDIKSQAGLIENVDFKGKNGIIVLPPSTHSSGKQYKWLNINPLEDGLDDLFDLPKDVASWIYNGGAPESSQDQRSDLPAGMDTPQDKSIGEKDPDWLNKALLFGVTEGKRDDICFRIACEFVRQDRPRDQILETLTLWNLSNKPPLDPKVVKEKCHSAEKYRGKNKFFDKVEKKMSNFTRVESKLGDHYFRQTINSEKYGDTTFSVTPEQLYNPRLYAVQLLRHTGKYMVPPKQVEWGKIVQDLIDNANEEQERDDATIIDFVRTEICKDIDGLKGQEYIAKDEFAKDKPIIDGGELILKVKHIQDVLKFDRQPMSARDITRLLKSLGFQPHAYGKSRTRTWKMDYAKFKAGGSE